MCWEENSNNVRQERRPTSSPHAAKTAAAGSNPFLALLCSTTHPSTLCHPCRNNFDSENRDLSSGFSPFPISSRQPNGNRERQLPPEKNKNMTHTLLPTPTPHRPLPYHHRHPAVRPSLTPSPSRSPSVPILSASLLDDVFHSGATPPPHLLVSENPACSVPAS